ncbi:serine/threonine-protein kinase [Ideonella sp. A 288]|uniref:serine/threonine-protein kinase n=1 Tax=Ideonella sp. A 288 TaxID=1962181 RepID=UPI0013033C09|nr:serine/threonine-protein kinase [Ideonella sp. A 288]
MPGGTWRRLVESCRQWRAAGRRGAAAKPPDHPAAAAPPPTADPSFTDRYQLEHALGEGAVGEVVLAVDKRTGAHVAIKFMARAMREHALAGPTASREWQAARRLDHPGIAAVLDAGEHGDQQWLVMALAPGMPLDRYTQPARLLPEPLALRVGARVADALAHAHAHGVVHRDLKPSNVLFDLPTGRVTLLDFGVARIDDGSTTRTGMTLGTPSYMAPEQLAGQPATAAVDTYALGVLLFELLTGRRPHLAATLGELLRAIASSPGARLQDLRPDLPAAVTEAVTQALSREATDRPADLVAYAARLDALADALPGALQSTRPAP